MAQVENVEAQDSKYYKFEELFEDRDAEIFDTILLNGPIDIVKKKLNLLKDQGTDIHNVYQYYFHFFTTDQTLKFLEFVDWCDDNYSLFERVITDITKSEIICSISPWSLEKPY